MGFFDDIGEAFSDAADVVVDVATSVIGAVSDVGSSAVDSVGSVASTVVESAGAAGLAALGAMGDGFSATWDATTSVGSFAGDTFAPVTDPFLDLAGDAFDAVGAPMLDALDSTLFEVVDVSTFGLIDIDFDDGRFSAQMGIDGVFGYGVAVGNGGFGVNYTAGGAGMSFHMDDTGTGAAISTGWDIDGLPYVDGEMNVASDGKMAFSGEMQGHLPLGVMVGGEVKGYYRDTAEGHEVGGSATVSVYTPAGQGAGVGIHGSHSEDAHGSHSQFGAHGYVEQVGVARVTGSVDYNVSGVDGVHTEGVSATAAVDAYGNHLEAGIAVEHQVGPDGETTTVLAHASADLVDGSHVEAGAAMQVRDGDVDFAAHASADLDAPDYDDFNSLAQSAGYDLPELPTVEHDVPDLASFDGAEDALRDQMSHFPEHE